MKKYSSDIAIIRSYYSDGVWKIYDIPLRDDGIQIIRDIVNSNETIIRFNGQNGKKYDLTMSESDKQITAEILELYDLLKR